MSEYGQVNAYHRGSNSANARSDLNDTGYIAEQLVALDEHFQCP